MTGFLEDTALRFEGVSDQSIANLNAILPDLKHLETVFRVEWPRINKVMPIVLQIAKEIETYQQQFK